MTEIDYTKFDAKFIDVTPQMADKFLESNVGNRRLRKSWTDALTREIKNGNYKTTHQGIAFTKSGVLVDGQHRLNAIKESNKTVKILVTTGLEDDVFKDIDRGLKRSIADSTHLPQKCTEACRLVAEHVFGTRNVSSQDVIDIFNTGFGQLHEELMKECSSTIKVFSSAPARLMAVVMVMDGHDKKYVFDVYRNMVLVNFDNVPNVAACLMKRATKGQLKGGGSTFQRDLMAMYKKIFDVGYKDLILRVSDADSSLAIQYVREVFKQYL